MNIGICGKGRIGSKVASKLREQGLTAEHFRLNPNLGLTNASNDLPNELDVLIICISAANSSTDWTWLTIFNGLTNQISNNQISIKKIIFVSSTGVYDGNSNGLIDAKVLASPVSDRAKALHHAERAVLSLGSITSILRCSGLTGVGYERYEQILATAEDRARFCINIASVVDTIVEQTKQTDTRSSISILTDGKVHYRTKAYQLSTDRPFIEELAKEYKILINSTNSVSL